MASFDAALTVEGQAYPVRHCTYSFAQATDHRGRVAARGRYGQAQLVVDVPADDTLLAWAATPHKPLAGYVTFFESDQHTARETLAWEAGKCVSYREEFCSGDEEQGAYVCHLLIAATSFTLQAGGAGQYVPPVAGQHGQPAATAAVVASAVVSRLPRITGHPPFTVKGPRPGKPGLDRSEFIRQLAGQQQGLNRLTVAEFLANRDHYLTQALLTGDGRDSVGDAAQRLAREKALRDKEAALRRQNRSLTKEQAKQQAQQWLQTQAALHDPDQVAGGHPHLITGLGEARVNSSIGAQWPKRIRGIDQQIRNYAASMTQLERENTYLDIELPVA